MNTARELSIQRRLPCDSASLAHRRHSWHRVLLVTLAMTGLCSAASRTHAEGTLFSWGNDVHGQVSGTPVGNNFIAASGGGTYSVALRSDGSLVSWGDDTYGQVSATPTGNNFIAASAGQDHTVALRSDGSLISWGRDNIGQVSGTPAGNNFIAASAGANHCVALRSDGSLVSWGYDAFGQVSGTPAGNNFVAASGGLFHSVALRSDGSLVSWGDDTYGQVSGTPTGNNFIAASAGFAHGVAIRSDGSLVSWGLDNSGQVSGTPAGNNFIAASGGGAHSIAIGPDVTPEAQIAALSDAVQALVTGGALLPSQGNSLQTKLSAALDQVTLGHTQGAVAKLNDFIKQVSNFVKAGKLTTAQGQPLIDAAQALINELQSAAALSATSSASTARIAAIGRPDVAPPATLAVPASFRLYPATSDAARGALTLHFDLPRPSEVTVEFYDLGGRRLDEVRLGTLGPGRQEWTWAPRTHGSALVFYRLKAGDFMASGKAALVR